MSLQKKCPLCNQRYIFSFIVQEHMIQSEVSILRRVKHPNIVLLIEEIDAHSELYLVMELVKVLEYQEPNILVIPG